MIYGSSKRIIVVRDIPSNMIEEAILILKHEPGKENTTTVSGKVNKKETSKVNSDYILKEAETIINSYINECKLEEKYPKKVILNNKILSKNKKSINLLLNAGLLFSVALLIFIISKFI